MADKLTGKKFGKWIIVDYLGKGGNATVYHVENGNCIGAIKLLKRHKPSEQELSRFRDEIEAIKSCSDIPGVLPIFDSNIPDSPTKDNPLWFVMAKAYGLKDALGQNANFETVVEAVRDIAAALEAMHSRNIAHRDIKPDNLFKYDGRWCVGDLGLAKFDGKSAETKEGEKVGAAHYIAPEMLNDAGVFDGKPADVYSLAKTLWVLVTGQNLPLPGSHSAAESRTAVSSFIRHPKSAALDILIEAATKLDPVARISMKQFVKELSSILKPTPESSAKNEGIDLSYLASQFESQRKLIQDKSDKQKQIGEWRNNVGLRLREKLRPACNKILGALKSANFISPDASIDNRHWGFEVNATIPWHTDGNSWVKFTANVNINKIADNGMVTINYRYNATIVERGSVQKVHVLWEHEIEFLADGSLESIEFNNAEKLLLSNLQDCVLKAIKLNADLGVF